MAKKKTTTKKVATKKMATKVKPQEVAKNSAKNAIKKKIINSLFIGSGIKNVVLKRLENVSFMVFYLQ